MPERCPLQSRRTRAAHEDLGPPPLPTETREMAGERPYLPQLEASPVLPLQRLDQALGAWGRRQPSSL